MIIPTVPNNCLKNLILAFTLLVTLANGLAADSLGIPTLLPTHANTHPKTLPPIPSAPKLQAKSYILLDANSGRVLAEHESTARFEPASLTKLISLYVIFQSLQNGSLSLEDKVLVSQHAWKAEGSRMFVQAGKQVLVKDLIKGIIVASGNDATIALAEHVGGSESSFVEMMNQSAEQLGMRQSHFVNVTGLPNKAHLTTAHDLAILTTALIRDFPQYYSWFSQKSITYNKITQSNRNKLLWLDNRVDGLKTGHTTSAGFCLITSAKDKDTRLITVIMGTNNESTRNANTQSLLGYGFRFYQTVQVAGTNKPLATLRLWQGQAQTIDVGSVYPIMITTAKGQDKEISTEVTSEKPIIAPIKAGQAVATLIIKQNNQTLARHPLVALNDAKTAGFMGRIWDRLVYLVSQSTGQIS